MAEVVHSPMENLPLPGAPDADLIERMKRWYLAEGYWYLVSAAVHAVGFVILALLAVNVGRHMRNDAPNLESSDVDADSGKKPPLFERGETPVDPTELNTDSLLQFEAKPLASQEAKYYTPDPVFEDAGGGKQMDPTASNLGGLGGFAMMRNLPGPAITAGGVGVGIGESNNLGKGGAGSGFGFRGKGHRDGSGGGGSTKGTERAVGAALSWLARHQMAGGNWSLDHRAACVKGHCSGPGSVTADAAATGMRCCRSGGANAQVDRAVSRSHRQRGVLAAEASEARRRFVVRRLPADVFARDRLDRAVRVLRHDRRRAGEECRAKGGAVHRDGPEQRDRRLRYIPGDDGDTSVTGWQMMALKSAQIAGLQVDHEVLERVKTWLKSCAKGHAGGRFSYQPATEATPTNTAIGALCSQYLGQGRDDPAMGESINYLLENLPDPERVRDCYYWYYATMVMHNYLGPEWDTWNRKMRKVLIATQETQGCATGSWDPDKPSQDDWGAHGGRLMLTSFGALTLEVYYRYLPLYKLDAAGETYTNTVKPPQK